MAKLNTEIEVKIDDSDLKEIVRLRCQNKTCVHNMIWNGYTACNLKNIIIGNDGKCADIHSFTDEYKEARENLVRCNNIPYPKPSEDDEV